MIRTFESGKDCNRKFNAVDDKNNLIGYNLDDDCCAHGGWFIAPEVVYDEPETMTIYDVSAYDFDLGFFLETPVSMSDYKAVVIRLIANGKPALYLHCYNVHNGYYSKGFNAVLGDVRKDINV